MKLKWTAFRPISTCRSSKIIAPVCYIKYGLLDLNMLLGNNYEVSYALLEHHIDSSITLPI